MLCLVRNCAKYFKQVELCQMARRPCRVVVCNIIMLFLCVFSRSGYTLLKSELPSRRSKNKGKDAICECRLLRECAAKVKSTRVLYANGTHICVYLQILVLCVSVCPTRSEYTSDREYNVIARYIYINKYLCTYIYECVYRARLLGWRPNTNFIFKNVNLG